MKVVLDTNIFISGIFWQGNPHKILRAWREGYITLVSSLDAISELAKVLGDFKMQLPDKDMRNWINMIVQNAEMVEPTEKIDVVKDDPSDNLFIEIAVTGNAKYIVSQDNHLLKLKKFNDIRIITPEEFMKLL